MIKPASIQQVIETARVEDIVKDYVQLKTRGHSQIGLCPFHKERTPSFTVSATKNLFKCFGCGKGGDGVKFIMEIEQLSFVEAVRFLARKYNIQLEELASNKENLEAQQSIESLNLINDWAKKYYEKILWETDLGRNIGLDYFKQRGFLESTIKKFELGFTPAQPDGLTKAAVSQSYSIDLLRKCGLTNSYEKDFFRERVIFPLHNASGKTIGFAGRVLQTNQQVAKYVNSPETEVYNKSKTLFGLHLSRQGIRKSNMAILVEGYTDVMALHQAGIDHAIASSGTSFTEEQAHIIKRFTENVTILYDGDQAGIQAALRALDILVKENINPYLLFIPDNDDPDSFLRKHGSEEFIKLLEHHKKDGIVYKAEYLLQNAGSNPILKSSAVKDVVSTIAKMDDNIKRSFYIQSCAQLMSVPESTLIDQCNVYIHENLKSKNFKLRQQAFENDEIILRDNHEITDSTTSHKQTFWLPFADENQERDIIRILMLSGSKMYTAQQCTVTEFVLANIADITEYFQHPLYSKILHMVQHAFDHGEIIPLYNFIHHEEPEVKDLALEFSFQKYELSKNWSDKYGLAEATFNEFGSISEEEILQTVRHIKVRKFDQIIRKLDEEIIKAVDVEEQYTLLKIRGEYKFIRNKLWLETSNQSPIDN